MGGKGKEKKMTVRMASLRGFGGLRTCDLGGGKKVKDGEGGFGLARAGRGAA